MLMTALDSNTAEIIIRGEFFELDKIYFLVERLRGDYGIPALHYLPDFENAASLLLGLTYEIRKAESGDRELYTMYNGIRSHWLAPAGTPSKDIMTFEEEQRHEERFSKFDDIILFDLDMDPDEFEELDEDKQMDLLSDPDLDPEEVDEYLNWLHRGPSYRFRREDYPEASETATCLQFRIPFAEGVLYAFVIETLLAHRGTIIENALTGASSPTNPLGDYELDYCLRRLPAELALLDLLKEHLFAQISSVCSHEEYIALRKKEAPEDFFRNLDDAGIEALSAAIKDCTAACRNDAAEVVRRVAAIVVPR